MVATTRPASRNCMISALLFSCTPICLPAQRLPDLGVDPLRRSHAVDLGEQALAGVVLLHLRNLGAKHLETVLQFLRAVVAALDEGLALDVAEALPLRRR